MGDAAGEWIPTEEIYPPLRSGAYIVAIALSGGFAFIGWVGLLPYFGLFVTLLYTCVATVAAVAIPILILRQARRSKVRVSSQGIEIVRPWDPVRVFEVEGLQLRPQGFGRFGVAVSRNGGLAYLSPNQFAAAKAAFPGAVRAGPPTKRPPP